MTFYRRNNGRCFGTPHHAVAFGRVGVVLMPKAILSEDVRQSFRSRGDRPQMCQHLRIAYRFPPHTREWTAPEVTLADGPTPRG